MEVNRSVWIDVAMPNKIHHFIEVKAIYIEGDLPEINFNDLKYILDFAYQKWPEGKFSVAVPYQHQVDTTVEDDIEIKSIDFNIRKSKNIRFSLKPQMTIEEIINKFHDIKNSTPKKPKPTISEAKQAEIEKIERELDKIHAIIEREPHREPEFDTYRFHFTRQLKALQGISK